MLLASPSSAAPRPSFPLFFFFFFRRDRKGGFFLRRAAFLSLPEAYEMLWPTLALLLVFAFFFPRIRSAAGAFGFTRQAIDIRAFFFPFQDPPFGARALPPNLAASFPGAPVEKAGTRLYKVFTLMQTFFNPDALITSIQIASS